MYKENWNEVEKMMDVFLSSEIGITERAIRLLKKNNPERYERELVGALVLSSGHDFKDVVGHFNSNAQLSILNEELKTKVNAISVLMKNSPVGDLSLNELSYFSVSQSRYIKDFLCKYFDGYRGKNGEGFNFEFYDWDTNVGSGEWSESSNILPILTVQTVDLGCGDFDSIDEEKITLIDLKTKGLFSLFEIIKLIQGSSKFENMKKTVFTPHKNVFDIKYKITDEDHLPVETLLIEIGDWKLYYKKIKIFPPHLNGNYIPIYEMFLECGDKVFGGDYGDEDAKDRLDILLSLYEKCTIKDNDTFVDILKLKVLSEIELFSRDSSEVPDRDNQAVSYLINLESIVVDGIQKGLYMALRGLEYSIDNKDISYYKALPCDKEGYYIEKGYSVKAFAVEDLVGCNYGKKDHPDSEEIEINKSKEK